MTRPPSGFQLVPDPALSAGAPPAPVEIGPGPVHVTTSGGELAFRAGLPEPSAHGVVIEPVRVGSDPKLVMVTADSWRDRVRINGVPAPSVALLGVRDEVQFDDQVHLHVTVYHQPAIGPAGDVHRGSDCPVCRGRIEDDAVVYTCPRCGVAMHCELSLSSSMGIGESRDRLACARLTSECSCCGAPIILAEGYEYVPQV